MDLMSGHDDLTSVSERVIDAITAETGKEPTNLEPLYYSIDTDSLETLFSDSVDPPTDSIRECTFTYENHLVRVSQDGSVEVSPIEEKPPKAAPRDPRRSHVQGDPQDPS